MTTSDLLTGGEMRSLIAGFDWSQTPLGRRPDWPRSLQSAVEIMLTSRYPMLVWWGPELTQLYNDAYIPVLGKRHPSGLGQPASICWKEAWPFVGALADAVMAQGVSTWSERLEMVMTRNGFAEEVYMTFSYSPILDDDGEIGGLFCTCTEETQRVLGDRRLAALAALSDKTAATKAIGEACQAVTTVLADIPRDLPFSLLYLLDEEERIARLVDQTGLEAGTSASPIHVTLDAGDASWPFSKVLASGSTVIVDDLAATVPSGTFPSPWPESPRSAAMLPLPRSGRGGLAGFLIVGISPRLVLDENYRTFLDLLARQVATALAAARAYEEERQRAEALAEIDRVKTDFFANVSHEFRTPLTLMLGPLEETLGQPSIANEDRQNIVVAHRNGLRLLKLVNALLDFSRVEAGRAHASYEATDLSTLTAELASSFRSACDAAGLKLLLDCPPLPEPVFVDRDMWEKIVLNLVSNAFKFTFEGEIAVSVGIDAETSSAVLTVRDTGTGIPREELPRIFERFHRIDNARGRTHEGTGIGLALVQELVRLHGGSVTVKSSLGQGTTFTVRLPFGRMHLPTDRVDAGMPQVSTAIRADAFVEEALRWLPDTADKGHPGTTVPTAAGEDRPRVLLVEDNADMRDYVRRLLEADYVIETAVDGQAALEALERHRPELVLADIMLPRIDGLTLLKTLRDGESDLRDLPVILLSARAGEEAKVEGLEAGADDYLVKPFSAQELLARVASTLSLARLRREIAEAAKETEALRQSETRLRESEARLAQEVADARLVQELSGMLIHEHEPQELFERIVGAAQSLMKADAASLQILDPGGQTLRLTASSNFHPASEAFWQLVNASSASSCGQALRTGGRVIVPDIETSAFMIGSDDFDSCLRSGLRAVQSTPLVTRSGKPIGMISTHWHEPHLMVEDDFALFDVLARQAADLIERTQAEARLRESEEGYRSLFEKIDEGFCVIEVLFDEHGKAMDYRFLQVNPAFERHTGIVDGEGRLMREIAAEHEQYWFDYYGEIALTGQAKRIEAPARALGDRWYDLNAFRVGDPSQHRVAILFRDVSQRQRDAEALRESEERLRQFGEASQDVLWIRDAQTLQWTYLTPAFETIYGLARAEALAGNNYRSWMDLIVPEDREHVTENIGRVRKGEHATFDYRIERPADGAIRWLRNTDFPIMDANGNVASIGGIGHDLTELRETELRLKTLVQGIPQLVWRAANEGNWTWASPQWAEFTGLSAADSVGWGWLEALHPDDRPRAREAWHRAVEKGGFEVEYRIRQAVGNAYRWFQTRATPVRDGTGAIIEWLGTSTDIHELRELQDRQRVLVAELQHRTRNLMGVVRATADRTGEASVDFADFRDRFRDRLEALARVQGLLSRLDETDRVAFDELIRTELKAMDGAADRVTLDGPSGIKLRSSMVQTLAMALHELATNAVKYGALGQAGGHLAITWRLKSSSSQRQPRLHIDWRESGVKMPPVGAAPQGGGQGRELIEQALPYQLDALTSFELGPDGVHCTIEIPVSEHTVAELDDA